jgi:hypothetical protein
MLGYEKGMKGKTEDELVEFDIAENDKLYAALPVHAKKLSGLVQLRRRLSLVDDKIEKCITNKKFVATKVFVVFEKEAYQRSALRQLTTGVIPAYMDANSNILPRYGGGWGGGEGGLRR